MSKGAILGPDSTNCLCLYPTLGISVIPGECVHLIDLSFGTWVHPLLNDSQKLDPSYVVIPSFYTVSAADVLWFGLEFNCAALHNSQEVKTPSSWIFRVQTSKAAFWGLSEHPWICCCWCRSCSVQPLLDSSHQEPRLTWTHARRRWWWILLQPAQALTHQNSWGKPTSSCKEHRKSSPGAPRPVFRRNNSTGFGCSLSHE